MAPLVCAVRAEAIGTVHATRASSLEARSAGDRASELHHGAGELVAHGDLAVVDAGGASCG